MCDYYISKGLFEYFFEEQLDFVLYIDSKEKLNNILKDILKKKEIAIAYSIIEKYPESFIFSPRG
jgi:hypothetical protein